MSSPSPTLILQGMMYFSDAIFAGLKILVPVLFLLNLFKINFLEKRIKSLTLSSNIVLLTGGLTFLFGITGSMYNTWFSEDEFGRDALRHMVSGPHWYQFILPIVGYGLLPQLMWINKIRHSLYASLAITMAWFVLYFIVVYLSYRPQEVFSFPVEHLDFHVTDFSNKMIIFISVIILTFILVAVRRRNQADGY